MTFKEIIEIVILSLLGFIIASLWLWILVVSSVKLLIHCWWQESEDYVKRMSTPIKDENEYQSLTTLH